MGGRGAYSTEFDEWVKLQELRRQRYKPDTLYNYTTSNDLPAGADHAFFSRTNRPFTIITYSTDEEHEALDFLPEHTFGQEEPTIRWMPSSRALVCASTTP